MYPIQHILAGFFLALLLYFLFPQTGLLGVSLIFFSSFIIDVDHYLAYVFKKKNFNLKKAYNWHMEMDKKSLKLSREERNNSFLCLCFLHGFEIFLIFLILGVVFSKYFLFISIGIAFHLFLDVIYGFTYSDRIDKLSVIYDFFNYKNLKDIESY